MDKPSADALLTQHGYTGDKLVANAMRAMRPRRYKSCQRWVAVMDTFGTGSTLAYALCVAHDYDPEETIGRR